ncbi:myb-like dna-binding, partial [Lasallia pustulata]
MAKNQQKPAQTRRPWSEEEVDRLIDLIERNGTSWSALLIIDKTMKPPLLQDRGQVGLKDKARNIKIDFLK